MSGRPLTADASSALGFLLAAEFPGVRELRQQAPFASVVGRCECGCATVELDVDRARAPAAEVTHRVPVQSHSVSGVEGLLLFVDDGYLSGLEIYSSEDSAPATFPSPSAFDPPEVAER